MANTLCCAADTGGLWSDLCLSWPSRYQCEGRIRRTSEHEYHHVFCSLSISVRCHDQAASRARGAGCDSGSRRKTCRTARSRSGVHHNVADDRALSGSRPRGNEQSSRDREGFGLDRFAARYGGADLLVRKKKSAKSCHVRPCLRSWFLSYGGVKCGYHASSCHRVPAAIRGHSTGSCK